MFSSLPKIFLSDSNSSMLGWRWMIALIVSTGDAEEEFDAYESRLLDMTEP